MQLTKSWAQGQTVLIGDACHPMMPNLGQGGCQAMEDGYMLTNMLKDVRGDYRTCSRGGQVVCVCVFVACISDSPSGQGETSYTFACN